MTERELLSAFTSEAVTTMTRGGGSAEEAGDAAQLSREVISNCTQGLVGEDGSRYHLAMSRQDMHKS